MVLGTGVVAGGGAGGYFAGKSSAPSASEAVAAREAAEGAARAEAERDAFEDARKRGLDAGEREGRRAAEERLADGREPPESAAPDTGASNQEPDADEADQPEEQAPASCSAGVEIIVGSVSCSEAEGIFDTFFSGGGVDGGSTAAGTEVDDWNCGGARMGTPASCFRANDGATITSSR